MDSRYHITASVANVRVIARDLKNLGMEAFFLRLDHACEELIDAAIYDFGNLERRLEDCRQQLKGRITWRSLEDLTSGRNPNVW